MSRWTTADIPDQTGRTAVITGANTGLGYETAAALAAKGAHVVLAVRNLEKGKEAARGIEQATPDAQVQLQELDLTSLDSIRAAADAASRPTHDIDRSADQQRRSDVHTEVDHQGRLRIAVRHQPSRPLRVHQPAARPRAGGAGFPRGDGQQRRPSLRPPRNPLRRPAVGARATAASAHTAKPSWPTCSSPTNCSAACKARNTIAAAAHPGGSRTELTRNLPPLVGAVTKLVEPLFQSADMGALPTLRAATDPGVLGGQYYGPDGFGEQRGYPKVVASSTASHDTDAQRRLWTVSEELTSVVSPVG